MNQGPSIVPDGGGGWVGTSQIKGVKRECPEKLSDSSLASFFPAGKVSFQYRWKWQHSSLSILRNLDPSGEDTNLLDQVGGVFGRRDIRLLGDRLRFIESRGSLYLDCVN